MNITRTKVTAALKKHGYPLFAGELNITLVGIRASDANANSFNDVLVVLFEQNGKKNLLKMPMTTDPGVYYRKKPLNVNGTAVLVPGHYKGCWRMGAHQGKYKALVQHGLMDVYRDADKNARLDLDMATIQRGLFGINLHRSGANKYSLQVDRWSAGCQVLSCPDDFKTLMDLAEQSAGLYGPTFSYTLLEEADLVAKK